MNTPNSQSEPKSKCCGFLRASEKEPYCLNCGKPFIPASDEISHTVTGTGRAKMYLQENMSYEGVKKNGEPAGLYEIPADDESKPDYSRVFLGQYTIEPITSDKETLQTGWSYDPKTKGWNVTVDGGEKMTAKAFWDKYGIPEPTGESEKEVCPDSHFPGLPDGSVRPKFCIPHMSSYKNPYWMEEEREAYDAWYERANPELAPYQTKFLIADYWLSRIAEKIQEVQKQGEIDGWKQGQLHGEAVGRQKQKARIVKMIEDIKPLALMDSFHCPFQSVLISKTELLANLKKDE